MRTQEVGKLAARCRRLPGWKVTRATGGTLKVTCPDGFIQMLHSTANVEHAMLAEIALNGHGLEADEKRYLRAEDRRRRASILEDRQRNEALTAKVTKQAAMVARAAGVDKPTVALLDSAAELDLRWALTPSKRQESMYVRISPAMAEKLLDTVVDYQRPQVASNVGFFRKLMNGETFRSTHQGMAFDWNGKLADGRHRLIASVETGTAILVMVTIGVDPDAYVAFDGGRQRSGRDVMGADILYPVVVAAASRLVFLYRHVELARWSRERVTNDEIVRTLRQSPEVTASFVECAAGAQRAYKNTKFPQGPHAAGMFLLRDSDNGKDYVDEWLHPLHTGLDLHSSADPRMALRRFVANAKETHRSVSGTMFLALFLKAWALHVEGRTTANLRWGVSEPLPPLAVLESRSVARTRKARK